MSLFPFNRDIPSFVDQTCIYVFRSFCRPHLQYIFFHRGIYSFVDRTCRYINFSSLIYMSLFPFDDITSFCRPHLHIYLCLFCRLYLHYIFFSHYICRFVNHTCIYIFCLFFPLQPHPTRFSNILSKSSISRNIESYYTVLCIQLIERDGERFAPPITKEDVFIPSYSRKKDSKKRFFNVFLIPDF